ncbi:hypothetical protein Csa_016887 [Cucumis sativus]|nr:hypothetical protein Csa_016887 [Cucumis sativus]
MYLFPLSKPRSSSAGLQHGRESEPIGLHTPIAQHCGKEHQGLRLEMFVVGLSKNSQNGVPTEAIGLRHLAEHGAGIVDIAG